MRSNEARTRLSESQEGRSIDTGDINHRAIPSLGLVLTATANLSAGPGEAQEPCG